MEAYYDSLTDDEKLGELLQLSISFFGVDCMVTGDNQTFPKDVIEHAGTLISNAKTGSKKNRAIQEEHMKHSKVPLLFMGDIVSGFAVAYPLPLAQAGTFDPDFVKKIARETAKAAKKADTVVLMIGEHWLQSGESASRADIVVPDIQMDLFREIYAVNKNIVAVVFAGRPLDLREVKKLSKAILFAWMPGDATSDGLANLLTGKAVPSAKLAMSMPYHVAQCPLHYDLYPTGHPSKGNGHRFSSRYVDIPNKPLYPFGYGLSYTKFTYSDITASAESMTADETIKLSVTVTNDGEFDGDEIVQLYLWDMEATRVSRPLRELKDFKRISLKKGESKEVTFEITEEMLRFLNYDGEIKSEPGRFTAYIGESSATDRKVVFTLK